MDSYFLGYFHSKMELLKLICLLSVIEFIGSIILFQSTFLIEILNVSFSMTILLCILNFWSFRSHCRNLLKLGSGMKFTFLETFDFLCLILFILNSIVFVFNFIASK